MYVCVASAGEDTALAPLMPQLFAALEAPGGVNAARVTAVGKQYVDEMRARLPAHLANATRIVDKMLRNAWNIGAIGIMLPRACIIHATRHPLDTALSCYAQVGVSAAVGADTCSFGMTAVTRMVAGVVVGEMRCVVAWGPGFNDGSLATNG